MASLALAFDILARDRGASRTFDKVGDSAADAGKKGQLFGKLLKGSLGVVAGAAGALATAGGAAAVFGIKTAAANEQAEISFSTMLGSAEKAGKFLGKLQAFAAKTPFEFPELQTAASSLISAGIEADKVIPIMTTLGDVTSGMGTGSEGVKRATIALQQMSAAGRITGEDLNQLRDAGIPVYDLLAKATGKSKGEVVKLAQAGKLGKKELGQMMKALESGKGLERFSGLMDKQSASLTGMWSTFKDTLGQGLAKTIQPVIPLLKDGMGKATEFLAGILPKVAKGLASVVKWLVGAHPNISKVVGGLKVFFSFLKGNDTGVDGPFRKMAVAGEALHKAFTQYLIPAVSAFFGWLKDDLWPALKDGYQTIMPGLKQAFDIIAGAFKSSGGEGSTFGEKLRTVGDIIATKVVPFLALLIRSYLPVLATNLRAGIEVVKALYKAFQTWKSIVSTVIAFILHRFADLSGMWANVLEALGNVPGFGWAKDAAKKLKGVADKADGIATALDNIDRNVQIEVGFKATSGRIKVGGQSVNIGMRAGGGPVTPGKMYQVGDNPDGSWNSTTEILRASGPARVVNQDEMRRALGATATPGATGRVDFSEATLQRLAALLSQVRSNATISAGSLDAAMGGGLRS